MYAIIYTDGFTPLVYVIKEAFCFYYESLQEWSVGCLGEFFS